MGQGTLYRHFATRDELVRALYDREIDELVALAHALLDEHPPRRGAASGGSTQLAAYARVKFGVIAAVEASVWQDIGAQTPGKLGEALDRAARGRPRGRACCAATSTRAM